MAKKQYIRIGVYLVFLGVISGIMLLIVGVLFNNAAASNNLTESSSNLLEGQGTTLLSHGGSNDGCMVERFNATKPASVSSLNCTSNDVELAQYNLLSGPSSCIEGEDINVTLVGEFVAPRLWEDPRTIDGGYTSNDPKCREYARDRSRRAIDTSPCKVNSMSQGIELAAFFLLPSVENQKVLLDFY